jgi:ribosomal protein S18 acetylase RimI-like enzyme
MEIKSLANTNFETIFNAFNQAFADYEMQLNSEQLQAMLIRRGFNPDLSFAAFENGEIVSFVFNGIGDFYGIQTAYDTGTGTLKEYRGQGLATKILEYSIPLLKEKNIKQYILEVLQHNTNAVSVYRNIGSEVTREFNYFIQKNENILNTIKTSELSYFIEKIDIENYDFLSDFWDFRPSWQNSFGSIKRAKNGFVCLGVFAKDKLVGYCVFEPVSGDVTQIAVDKQHRRKGVATLLLNEIMKLNKNTVIRVINTDVSCESITSFLNAKNIVATGKQFEMIKKI